MAEYLVNRRGYWHFVRRVPLEFATLDPRGIVRHSTKVAVAKDRRRVKADKIAEKMNRDLEIYWRDLYEGGPTAEKAAKRYAEARTRARIFRFDIDAGDDNRDSR